MFDTNFNLTAELVLMAITFGLGYYIGERGVKGVENDMSDVKTDVATIKAHLFPVKTTVSVNPNATTTTTVA